MATSGPNPLPPTTVLSSKPISQSAAHDFLAAYLDRAATDPALQPNAIISEHGPVSRTTASAPNLILHNLKRVQAGLAGEVLGRDLTLPTGAQPQQEQNQQGADGDATAAGGDWEDRQKWELTNGEQQQQQQDETAGDFAHPGEEMQVDEDGMPVKKKKIDKEERKRKKKERRQAEKRAKAKKGTDADEAAEASE
ncbi:hypothetical protein VTN96DRAFT_2920 [Rasamsonia emersonii]|uniref:Uncharacterized protein n=1 Tax=Rasamsonia emersonii (strain ATCC 16479 / CBS 393.64 / IMI 116815) TaxID=1408163 RepID=A0A0F4YSS1_RASE3|nr:hypothetical protein T310_4641 [Rasamsonia emersonii CBS 393.64]KKA21337.1 hypothetical protein T310_4641 [Rasamsonia emersonii CBS 393.64]